MIGRSVGRFRITAKLGEGGMGSVWKAEDSLLGRSIALKFLPKELSTSPEARQRFLREAQAASSLHHPGIATVHDAGEADGLVYIAMHLVDGETLSDRVARGPLSIPEAVRITSEAAEALGHAHSHGVLHRDISARNIMVERDGRTVVVDFGLALPEGQTRLTQTGTTMGTVAYMAPEVALGAKADRRSDLYGLGAVLYEMLTGAPPFDAEQPQVLLYATVHQPAAPPSTRRPGLSHEIDAIVLKALAKDPGQRYQSAQELLADLNRVEEGALAAGGSRRSPPPLPIGLDAAPTEPIEISTRSQASKTRGRRGRVAIGTGVVLVLASMAFVALRDARTRRVPVSGPHFPSIAVLPLRNVSADPSSSEFLVEGIGEALVTRLTELPNLRVIPWITSQRYSDRSRPLRDIAKELDVEVLLVGSFRRLADSLQTTVSLVDGRTGFQRWADDLQQPYGELFSVQRRIAVDVARSVRGQLTGEEEQTLARPAAQSVEAYEYYLRGSYALQTGDKESQDLAFGLFQKALEIDPNLEMAHVGAGAILTARYYSGWGGGVKNLADAEVHFNEALRSNPGSAPARDGLIRVFFDQGKEEECLKQGKEVEKLGLEDAEHLMARANAYHFGSLWDKAIPLYRHVLQIDPANQGARFFITVSNVLLGKYREGIAAGDTLIARYGDDPEATSAVAWAYHCLGDFERARSFYERAYKQDPEAADAPLAIGTTFRQSQQPDRARPEIQLAIKIFENELALYPEDPWRSATLAVAYAMLGNREQVMHEESRLLKEAPDNGIVLAYLGRAHAALGDTQRALELWRRALQLGTRYQIPVCPCLEQAGAESVRRDPGYPQFLKEFEAAGNRLRARY